MYLYGIMPPAPVHIEKQKLITYYNVYGGTIIKTTYDPNTNTYTTKRIVFNKPPCLNCDH